jgi:hypothetical protein
MKLKALLLSLIIFFALINNTVAQNRPSYVTRCNTCNKELYGPQKNRECNNCGKKFTNFGYTYLYNKVGYENEISNLSKCEGVYSSIHNGRFWTTYADYFVCCSSDCAIKLAKRKGRYD